MVDILIASDKGVDVNKVYIAELEADIMPIDELIIFAEFEAVKSESVAQYVCDIKIAGRKYCDCLACEAIFEKKGTML